MDAIHAYAGHVTSRHYADLPEAAIAAAKTFILDTLGVGIAGSGGPLAAELRQAQRLNGRGDDARVWATAERLPAAAAATCNAYQTHNAEFDCVHEAAVAHVVTVLLPVALAGAERLARAGQPVDGRRLIEAVVLGVDVAASLGLAASSGLRFFRPATVGLFGGVAALGKLMSFDREQLLEAFSVGYGQLSGTMQAHTEGSLLLAMQMGFAARNAVVACDLAAHGFTGPRNILEGPFGYFKLIEAGGDPARLAADLGRVWRITEVAHKPFPSGRATHGIVDGCLELRNRHAIRPEAITRVTALVPPLVQHLVGRPPLPAMPINYARLCAPWVAACVLRRGTIQVADFTDAAYADPATQALARRVSIVVRDAGNSNALTPVTVAIEQADGTRHTIDVAAVYGSPAKPMSRAAQLAKLLGNAALGTPPVPEASARRLAERIDRLEDVVNVAELVDLVVG